ncbi:hypothetical protein LTR17_025449 [Elasticomyces elasticus]|nr:hypothetical protein LTR17_025449 [Elasticomyces elasticus]
MFGLVSLTRTLLGLDNNTTPPYEVVVKPRHVRKAEEKVQRDVQARNYRDNMARRKLQKDKAAAHEKARSKRRLDESKVNAAEPDEVADQESPISESEYDSATEKMSQDPQLPQDTSVSEECTEDAVDAVDAALHVLSERLAMLFLWAVRVFVAIREAIAGQLTNLTTPNTAPTPQQPPESMMDIALALSNVTHPQYDKGEARRIIWRTVVRANYFWLRPDTNEPTSIKPILAYIGSIEEHYVHWLAEQEEEAGRTIPTAIHTDKVRTELCALFSRFQDNSSLIRLAHLAFLCRFEEQCSSLSPRALSLAELQMRIGLAFSDVPETAWMDFHTFRPIDNVQEGITDMKMELAELESIWGAVQGTGT